MSFLEAKRLAERNADPGKKFDVEDRDDLAKLLRAGAALEHSLALEYLYAGYTVKRPGLDEMTSREDEAMRRWRGTLFLVARQEMEHLGIVNNLLNAIGERPDFERDPFPQDRTVTPEGLPLELRRLDKDSLGVFIQWERPGWKAQERLPPNLKRHLLVRSAHNPFPAAYTLEELYLGIRDGFEKLTREMGEDKLFVGNPAAQHVYDDPSRNMLVQAVRGIDDARSLIYQILEEGEGFSFVNEQHTTHFERFCLMAEEMKDLGSFVPSRPVVDNPTVLGTHGGTTLRGPAAQVGELFNLAYDCMVLALARGYQYRAEDLGPKGDPFRVNAMFNLGFQPLMTNAIRPLGEMLTEMPSGAGDGTFAGPPFERLTTAADLDQPRDAFYPFLRGQLQKMLDLADTLAGPEDGPCAPGVPERMKFVRENLKLMVRKYDNEMQGVPQ